MAAIEFHHPYEPYDIQKQFMTALYACIEEGKVGIFESPTGKGKSLSLICGSLTWLRGEKKKTFETGVSSVEFDEDEPEWVREHAQKQRRTEATQRHKELEEKLSRIREKERSIREQYENAEPYTKRRKLDQGASDTLGEDQFLLQDYDSDEDSWQKPRAAATNGISAENAALMSALGLNSGIEDAAEIEDEMKIFFCSRTHSQLTQFAKELSRVSMPPAIAVAKNVDDPAEDVCESFKHITLGSRKNLCINPKVNKLGNATAINERCMELQQPSTAATSKCPFVPTKETEAVVQNFRDHALATIRDIEDLGNMGRKFGICPYYASRSAVKPSEIVTLPYPLLLQRSAREALDLSLKGHVVIIDEAHNLIDSITGIHSASVSLSQLAKAREQLMVYLQKFKNRLKGKNRTYVAQTVRLLDSLIACLKKLVETPGSHEGTVDVQTMMTGKGADQINIYKLDKYLQESKLARKVDGYIAHEDTTARPMKGPSKPAAAQSAKTTPVLMQVQSFLLTLVNPSSEGQFFYSKEQDGEAQLKYLLLDPTHHFKEVVEEARSVILVGGTMSPMSDFTQHLFSYVPPSRITTLSCGHVIPASNLLALPIVQGSSGASFDFTYEKRNSSGMIQDLGLTIKSLIEHIPDGVVVFFPSYTYLDSCVTQWKKSSSLGSKSIWDALQSTKPIYLESRSQHATVLPPSSPKSKTSKAASATTETVLAAYTSKIFSSASSRGALLLAVIGGSLSEGINFSDRLGRGVLVVGLPFPNSQTAEWKAKLEYVSKTASSRGQSGKDAAREYYENACMRAVNQSVGRAIRHKGDYAAIMMLDRRYGTKRIQEKLPGWIRGGIKSEMRVGEVCGVLAKFFEEKECGRVN
ncbi:ATP-dependent RNA helicase-like protein chl1 [Pseudovirgaria hyperparasitica]|uniref:ATP-dependent DNA helicase CHL1 n=1 Tax=Pseudovirgaria hyperparasitica TaxID=470096 RepID=A0A6A6WDG7_9PEZI|nr:ATP-dependent RNA helicase-like protein chl1 [Pseudovirgaria hyperparasitica]KAF2760010.1 ATP-dependent RNA helicase-like protein chl1 [Pseudovirgaria hyperparasitica]